MHEGLCSKSEFTRLLAIALLNWADDEGYFMANPVLIRGQVFPFLDDSKIIPRSLNELSSVGWIELGKDTEGRAIGRVVNFSKHQRVDKPKDSIIKDKAIFQDQSKMNQGIIQDESKEEGKGREEEGKVLSAPADEREVEKIFQAYPAKRRGGRKEAHKAIRGALKDVSAEALLANVESYARSQEVQEKARKGEWSFVPLLSTWMNKGRYDSGDSSFFDQDHSRNPLVDTSHLPRSGEMVKLTANDI